jgi:hypothetical protein
MAVMKAGHKELMTIMETNREKMVAKLDAHHERMMARMNSQLENTEATDLEANPEEIQSKTEREEVPKEEAAVETFGALKEQYGEQHLVVGRH